MSATERPTPRAWGKLVSFDFTPALAQIRRLQERLVEMEQPHRRWEDDGGPGEAGYRPTGHEETA